MSSEETEPSKIWNFPETSVFCRSVLPLSRELSYSVLVLNAYLATRSRLEGTAYHGLMREWMDTGKADLVDLWIWLTERRPAGAVHRGHYDRARAEADRWRKKGVWVAACAAGLHAGEDRAPSRGKDARRTQARGKLREAAAIAEGDRPCPPRCPHVLFGVGTPQMNHPWAAVFNSRKPRLVDPHDEWLEALRALLPRITSAALGLAGSHGTLAHDMVTARAQRTRSPLLLISSEAAEEVFDSMAFPFDGGDTSRYLVCTCRTAAARCPKATRMLCRDRMLVFLADLHLVIEIRSGGNLLGLLEAQQLWQPRHQWIYRPQVRSGQNEGNFRLLAGSSGWSGAFSAEDIGARGPDGRGSPGLLQDEFPPDGPLEVGWHGYLYHYTRSCPGPWPGQSYRDYLLTLLDGEPLSAHTALDTLVRILKEERIRGSSKLVRGDQMVVSWTSRSPLEIEAIRRWNPALIRWTFEPFGIAVKREELRKRGIKPTIYAKEGAYRRLSTDDCFRFQRDEPPRCSWRHEKEWRLVKDLCLREIQEDAGLIFVAERKDRERIERVLGKPRFPVVALSDLGPRAQRR